MARSKQFVTLGEAIDQFLKNHRFESKINEVKLYETWETLVGKAIKSHTKEIYIREKTLYVKVDSSVVRQEINFMKRRLAEKINKAFNSELIDQVVVL
jgi:predicted nucleic acid-binding Zn ribbon protein